jgi:hypothetical protein
MTNAAELLDNYCILEEPAYADAEPHKLLFYAIDISA